MNEDDQTPKHAEHPEELLSAYVSGEASEADRVSVQDLMSSCSECQREVELAVQARAALQSLPELDAPGLRVERMGSTAPAAQERAAPPPRGILDRVREWGWERLAWGAGLIAAGSLVALFVLVQSSEAPLEQQAGRPQTGAEANQQFLEGRANYTPGSLDALARRLVASQRTALSAEQTPAPAAAPTDQSGQARSDVEDRARDCLRRGGGLSPQARPVHVEEASFRGIPAYIGAFRSGVRGGRQYLLVLAVDHRSCDALYVINRSL